MAFFTSTLPGGWEVSYKTIEERGEREKTELQIKEQKRTITHDLPKIQ